MSTSQMAFNPTDGLRNVTSFPTTPANEAAARDQVQTPSDQLRDYINNTLIPVVDAKAQIVSGGAKVQSGTATITTSAAAGTYSVTVTFPTAFSSPPVVTVTTQSTLPDTLTAATIDTPTATSVKIYIKQNDANVHSAPVDWIAIGS